MNVASVYLRICYRTKDASYNLWNFKIQEILYMNYLHKNMHLYSWVRGVSLRLFHKKIARNNTAWVVFISQIVKSAHTNYSIHRHLKCWACIMTRYRTFNVRNYKYQTYLLKHRLAQRRLRLYKPNYDTLAIHNVFIAPTLM